MKRNHCVSVRLNEAELAKLDAQAKGRQRGAFLRNAWLSGVKPAVPELNSKAWFELSRAAANLNQIAARLNYQDAVSVDEIKQALTAFRLSLVGAKL